MKREIWIAAFLVISSVQVASAAPVVFGGVTVDTSNGPTTVVTGGTGRTGTFISNASTPFTTAGVTTFGQLAGGVAGSALFVGESFSGTSTSQYLTGTAAVTFAAPIFNIVGNNLAVFVSGQLNTANAGGFKETTSVRVLGSSGRFWYQDAFSFTETLTNANNDRFGFFTYLYDLSDLGVANFASINGIEISNFSPWATVIGGSGDGKSGEVDDTGLGGVSIVGGLGNRFAPAGTGGSCVTGSGVLPAGTTGNSYCLSGVFGGNTFERFDTDPDLLYAAALQGSTAAQVPLPGTLWLALAGFAALGAARRRS